MEIVPELMQRYQCAIAQYAKAGGDEPHICRNVRNPILAISTYIQDYSFALDLFERCNAECAQAKSLLQGLEQKEEKSKRDSEKIEELDTEWKRLVAWQFIASREAIFEIFHVFDAIDKSLNRNKNKGLFPPDVLLTKWNEGVKQVETLRDNEFPSWKVARDKVGHRAETSAGHNIGRESVSGPTQFEELNIREGGAVHAGGYLKGDRFSITGNDSRTGKASFHHVNMNRDTLTKLVKVQGLLFEGLSKTLEETAEQLENAKFSKLMENAPIIKPKEPSDE